MKGLFIPEITAEMFRTGCLESIEALMAEGEIYDIEYEPKRKPERKGKWLPDNTNYITPHFVCSACGMSQKVETVMYKPIWAFCPRCGARMMEGERND